MNMNMKRVQILGDVSRMGSDTEVAKELDDIEASEAAVEAEEQEAANAEAERKKMEKRNTKKLMKFN